MILILNVHRMNSNCQGMICFDGVTKYALTRHKALKNDTCP